MTDEDVERRHAASLASLDPLLPEPPALTVGVDEQLLRAVHGDSVALGLARHHRTTSESPDALWGALSSHSLELRLAGEERASALDALLDSWQRRIDELERPRDWESSASVTVPSRDLVLANVLTGHGFGPNGITAVRRKGARGPQLDGADGGIRHAVEDDLDAIADLDLELMRHDGNFGGVGERAGARTVLHAGLVQRFQAAPDWTWVMERDGRVVGFLHVLPPFPESAGHLASTSYGSKGAYIVSIYIDPAARGAQLGAQLVRVAHEALDAADVPVTTLAHAVQNPHSTPFWARMGYRPLWTTWQRRPARWS